MGRIKQLDSHLATLIAAGEVVTGPASVVRELVDNALDAGARAVDIAVESGGISRIRVADDGIGMDREDAIASLERHATSKIAGAEDLSSIRTLGFRGEALAAIVAVSRMRIETQRPEDMEGTAVRAAGGAVQEVRAVARRPGTTVEVGDLFYNTPARREYLDSERAEGGRVLQSVMRLAIARPDVRFTLRSGERELLNVPETDDLLERIRQVYDAGFTDELLPLLGQRGEVVVSGYVTAPSGAVRRARRNTFVVNGRPFESYELKRVLTNEFAGMLPSGRHPEAVVCIDLPPTEVDVNVSPDKSQVRFRRAGQVWAAATDALRYALGQREAVAPLGPESRGASSAPAQPDPAGAEAPAGSEPRSRRGGVDVSQRLAALRRHEAEENADPRAWEKLFGEHSAPTPPPREREYPVPAAAGAIGTAAWVREPAPRHGIPADPPVVLQVSRTFLACAVEGGMLIVDQHSAHERVHYERLRERYEKRDGAADAQPLMFPEALRLDPHRAELLQEMQPYLRRLGFDLTPAGPREMLVQAAPSALGERPAREALEQLMEAYEEARGQGLRSAEAAEHISPLEDRLLKTVACHAAIKKGQSLSEAEIRALWGDLVRIDLAAHDVHGRPGVVFLSSAEIARRMERSL